jgi:hypothetical protein
MSFMHEFKKFVDDSFEKFPVSLEETWILAYDIHDIAGDDGLVIFSSNHLCESEQFLNEINKEPFFSLFI